METVYIRHCVELARFAYRQGMPITADTHMRYALAVANRLQRRDLQSRIFRIRNKLRPAVLRSMSPRATAI